MLRKEEKFYQQQSWDKAICRAYSKELLTANTFHIVDRSIRVNLEPARGLSEEGQQSLMA